MVKAFAHHAEDPGLIPHMGTVCEANSDVPHCDIASILLKL